MRRPDEPLTEFEKATLLLAADIVYYHPNTFGVFVNEGIKVLVKRVKKQQTKEDKQ